MDKLDDLYKPQLSVPDLYAAPRKIELQGDDAMTVSESIGILEKSRSKQEHLFDIFSDWQTKRTLTTKRVFVSTSLIVVAASWIGIDYIELSFFGLKIADGSPHRFIIFVLLTILISGLFYEVSRRIDISVRNAKVSNVSEDLDVLKKPVDAIDSVMKRNNISSFRKLYFDFESTINRGNQEHHAVNAFNAVHFYRKHLAGANQRLNTLTLLELGIIYSIATCASVVLLYSLFS